METPCSSLCGSCWFLGRVAGLCFKVSVAEPSYSKCKKKMPKWKWTILPCKNSLRCGGRTIRKGLLVEERSGINKASKQAWDDVFLYVSFLDQNQEGPTKPELMEFIGREALLQGSGILFLGVSSGGTPQTPRVCRQKWCVAPSQPLWLSS